MAPDVDNPAPHLPRRVSVLTTSFPTREGDSAGHFILDQIRQMPASITHTVIAPSDARSDDRIQPFADLTVRRFRYFFPKRWQLLTGGNGMAENLRASNLAWLNVPFFLAALLFAALRAGRKGELIHCHWSLCGFAAVLTRPFHHRPVVVTVRGTDIFADSRILQWFNRLALTRVEMVMPVTASMKERLEAYGVSANRVRVLPASMHCPDEASIAACRAAAGSAAADGYVRLLFVGRLVHVKAVDLLLDALGSLRDKHLPIRMRIVGDGGDRACLEERSEQLQLQDTVEFIGQVSTDEVPVHLAGAEIFVLCSRSEGLPYSLWEAMSYGVASIATDVGGVSQLIRHEQTGLMVEPHSAAQLAAAIERLVLDAQLRDRLAEAGRRHVLQLAASQGSITEALTEVYRAVYRPATDAEAATV